MTNDYTPLPEHKFSFGLWTVGNRGRDPFGDAVRPPVKPTELVRWLGEAGAWGVNLHDNDLVPIDASTADRDRIVAEFKGACADHGVVTSMVSANLFFDPVFRDGAFTSNDPAVRGYALQKTLRAMDLGGELGAKTYVVWGGREGTETDACRRPDAAVKRLRDAIDYVCDYSIANGYGYRIALEAKPNEPRGDIYFPTTGAYLGFITTLAHSEMVGVNPEVAHEHMAGLNMTHAVAQAWEAGKLFHIDLNDQVIGRHDQDFRFAAANPKAAFFLVKFLEDVGYDNPRHFDAHAYRTEDDEGVRDFARGCMRTYLILKEKAARWNADAEIQGILKEISADRPGTPTVEKHSTAHADALLAFDFDRKAIGQRRLPYEKLDQLTIEILLGAR
ncbi:MAG: xylose isomerase [Vicinamibacterales bacterium]|jgi:xylose isomerase|nr:xylose isomerase [Vicinamibacterales bacterium]MDP6608124.1 xylose isomerase [Vicinamibacterales bacterium]HAK53978.1 xylose isomerase [Acidobacteriota bacterium]|tara:strand:+ start:6102 stop:7268 length:1167 start_codon:yes stop_codon:yes gene_type:complete